MTTKEQMISYYNNLLDNNPDMGSKHRSYYEKELISWQEKGSPTKKGDKKSKGVRRSSNPILCGLNDKEYTSLRELKEDNNLIASIPTLSLMLNGKVENRYGIKRKYDKDYLLNQVKEHYNDFQEGKISISEMSKILNADWETIKRRIIEIEKEIN